MNSNLVCRNRETVRINEYFQMPKNSCIQSMSYEDVKFFVTAKKEEFSLKLEYWLEINKEIRLANLRTND